VHFPDDMSKADTARALLAARARRYATVSAEEKSVHCTVVTFTRGKGRYALPLVDLREIRALSSYCAMPGASLIVPGVLYYRGELLSLHDLGAYVSGQAQSTEPSWVLVAEHANERIGLLADGVNDVLALESSEIKNLPLTMGEAGEMFMGMTDAGILVAEAARMLQTSRFVSAY
jgi:chemotaxis signal transduction protein